MDALLNAPRRAAKDGRSVASAEECASAWPLAAGAAGSALAAVDDECPPVPPKCLPKSDLRWVAPDWSLESACCPAGPLAAATAATPPRVAKYSSRRLKKASLSAWDILANIWVVEDLKAESNRLSPEMEGNRPFTDFLLMTASPLHVEAIQRGREGEGKWELKLDRRRTPPPEINLIKQGSDPLLCSILFHRSRPISAFLPPPLPCTSVGLTRPYAGVMECGIVLSVFTGSCHMSLVSHLQR